jgi:circadian clock protein KaiB
VKDDDQPRLQLRLYVCGTAPNSLRAIENTKAMCAKHSLAHHLEIVDLMDEPGRATGDRVIVTPTLIKLAPEPQQRLIGDLSDAQKLLATLSGGSE